MNQYIVITSIHEPSDAVAKWARLPNWRVLVVGDRKTPSDWNFDGVEYLSPEAQRELVPGLADVLPWNTYIRKNIGYAVAIRRGASAIFETDDDNLPYPDAHSVLQRVISAEERPAEVNGSTGWYNAYEYFGAPGVWPRGYPLERIHEKANPPAVGGASARPLVWQFLADREPDVDAIFRLTRSQEVRFEPAPSIVLGSGTYCPFNSQATLWLPDAYPLMFLPTGVSDRVTDILRGFMVQRALWAAGSSVGFCSPIVYQERNEHNLLRDLEDEMRLYTHAELWRNRLNAVLCTGSFTHDMKAILSSVLGDEVVDHYARFIAEIENGL
ncbi:MAG: DUF288 domain-containing protein [Gemmatimonadota bacterium]